jgi:hypothetical protein
VRAFGARRLSADRRIWRVNALCLTALVKLGSNAAAGEDRHKVLVSALSHTAQNVDEVERLLKTGSVWCWS